jgi:hypothetical protein
MGILDSILSQVLSGKSDNPLVADIGKVVTDALNSAEAPAGGDTPEPNDTKTTKPAATTNDDQATPPAAAPDAADTDTPDADTPAPPAKVDVAAQLDAMLDQSGEDLDWRHSIVDLLKLLGQDSSLSARKHLADELNYDGDTDDSASMVAQGDHAEARGERRQAAGRSRSLIRSRATEAQRAAPPRDSSPR